MLSPTAAGVRVPGSPEEVRSAGETNMSREENKSKFGGRLGYILNDSTALPRVTFSNGLIRSAISENGALFCVPGVLQRRESCVGVRNRPFTLLKPVWTWPSRWQLIPSKVPRLC